MEDVQAASVEQTLGCCLLDCQGRPQLAPPLLGQRCAAFQCQLRASLRREGTARVGPRSSASVSQRAPNDCRPGQPGHRARCLAPRAQRLGRLPAASAKRAQRATLGRPTWCPGPLEGSATSFN